MRATEILGLPERAMGDTRIRDAGVEDIGAVDSLDYLALFERQITGIGLRHLD
jgi:hypothetical protein